MPSATSGSPKTEGKALVPDPDNIRLAMLGMVDGNGHPFSWSAIINGEYDAKAMAACGYPVIPQYLGAEPKQNLGIAGVKVTHVWCDEADDGARVAKASHIANVLERATDAIGRVDAVVIATDKGFEHVQRARPFIEAGIPVFIDKPLADNVADLRTFTKWQRQGRPVLSTSCMRYAREFLAAKAAIPEKVGEPRVITMTTCKTWERYGIHALEGVYPMLEPGKWISVTNTGTRKANIVHVRHASGVDVILIAVDDMYGAFAKLAIYGTKGTMNVGFEDTFFSFKAQLEAFVRYLRTGVPPFPFAQTVELVKIIIAGIWSRDESGRTVMLEEIDA